MTTSLRMTPDARRKLFILAHWKLTTMSAVLAQLIEAEWVNYLIANGGDPNDKNNGQS